MKPKKPPVVDFRKAQEELRSTLRQGMLDEATRLLTEAEPSALTGRRVGEAVNCSTTLLYSLFGGKDGRANIAPQFDDLPPVRAFSDEKCES